MMIQCRCLWEDERCPNPATQEDGLCDWCCPAFSRTMAQLSVSSNACFDAKTGEYVGLGGGGEGHVHIGSIPDACWMPDSGAIRV